VHAAAHSGPALQEVAGAASVPEGAAVLVAAGSVDAGGVLLAGPAGPALPVPELLGAGTEGVGTAALFVVWAGVEVLLAAVFAGLGCSGTIGPDGVLSSSKAQETAAIKPKPLSKTLDRFIDRS
jgi:hypothetical protein